MISQQCPHCGAFSAADDQFCGECGRPLALAADSAAPSYPPPPGPAYTPRGPQPPRRSGAGCWIAGIVVVLGVVLCGALIVGGVIVLPDILPLIGPTPTGSGVIFGDQAPVLLVNKLDLSVCYFYISPSGSSEWGEDWLGSDRVRGGGGA